MRKVLITYRVFRPGFFSNIDTTAGELVDYPDGSDLAEIIQNDLSKWEIKSRHESFAVSLLDYKVI